jgi:dienelactone hydrolase
MRFIFEDEAFEFEALHVAGLAGDAGADIGEVLATTAQIGEGDEDGWAAAWRATAERTARRGEDSLAAGDQVSAREAFFRASSYYHSAEFFRRKEPTGDAALLDLSRRSRAAFATAAGLLATPFREVAIPYDGGELPGDLFLADDSGVPRPTIVYTSGATSTREEGYFVIGAAALRRGYHFLAYDGPGQGSMIREKGVPIRPDWENVLGRVVDYALTVPEIDPDEIVQFGYGLGGHLVARYASRDHRSAALVLNDGMTTFYASFPAIPEHLLELIEEGRDDEAVPMLDVLMKEDTFVRWKLHNGRWVFGAPTAAEYVRSTAHYTLTAEDIAGIRTPALVLEGDGETGFAGQATSFAHAMTAPVRHVVMRSADGAGRHRRDGAMAALQQTVFNHLGQTLRRGVTDRRNAGCLRSRVRPPAVSPSPGRG